MNLDPAKSPKAQRTIIRRTRYEPTETNSRLSTVIAMPCIARLLMIAIIRVATSALSLGEISEWTTAVRTFGHPKRGRFFQSRTFRHSRPSLIASLFLKYIRRCTGQPLRHVNCFRQKCLALNRHIPTERQNTAEKEGERIVPQPDSSWGVHESPPGTSIFPGTPRRLHPCGQRKLAVTAGTRRRMNTSRLALRFAMARIRPTRAMPNFRATRAQLQGLTGLWLDATLGSEQCCLGR
jgi:hypothetical protein